MPHIVIDGYNYINRIGYPGTKNMANLELQRKSLLDRLVLYKKQKPNKITVVFDAYRGYSLTRQRENYKGIDVVYTRENETADDVMIEWIRKKPSGLIVVTSDRAILDEAKSHGVAFITPIRFEELIMGIDLKEEDLEDTPKAEKKGNPRKLPKKLRKTGKVISKI
ncbi:MAG TPA: NYN domain-containing protein [Syntrophorhabdaceae bacterium]|nr:NYN domain-containing protein [Syntrophorhabdaceae bacterium]HOL05326.1 NYN domain-containing protein [Syntrophorhabdaceae bacterium]HPP41748.1 NYN domain-containing protein [Syntrophorhabdaceae bacterium]